MFYRWLLGQEHYLTGSDLVQLDPVFAGTYKQLVAVAEKKLEIQQNPSLDDKQKQAAIQALTVGDCPVADLGLDFLLPGTSIELIKAGAKMAVTIDNIEQYLRVIEYCFRFRSVYILIVPFVVCLVVGSLDAC